MHFKGKAQAEHIVKTAFQFQLPLHIAFSKAQKPVPDKSFSSGFAFNFKGETGFFSPCDACAVPKFKAKGGVWVCLMQHVGKVLQGALHDALLLAG
jgi:hypothetical protein